MATSPAPSRRPADPFHRYVVPSYVLGLSDELLEPYLEQRGLGWIVLLRQLLWSLDPLELRAAPLPAGRKPFHPLSLLGLVLYALLKRVQTPKAIAALATQDVGALYMTRGLQPSTAKVEHFLRQMQERLPSSLFLHVTRQLLETLDLRLQQNGTSDDVPTPVASVCALDGTVVASSATRRQTLNLQQATELQRELKQRLEETFKSSDETLFFEAGARAGGAQGARHRRRRTS